MSNYVQSTNFATKDALSLGDPLKIVKGTEINTEFNNIATAVGTKADIVSPTFTGTPSLPAGTTGVTQSSGNSSTLLATTAFATASISPFTGSMLMWPTVTPPSGFLLCSGAAVSRTTYAALFAIVGVIFGSGDGSTTFNLPDYRNRMPIGAGTTYSAAGVGGSADAIVVSHTHVATVTDPGHTHNTSLQVITQNTANGAAGGGDRALAVVSTTSSTTGITVANASAGVSGTNANLPPYIGIFFIIKT